MAEVVVHDLLGVERAHEDVATAHVDHLLHVFAAGRCNGRNISRSSSGVTAWASLRSCRQVALKGLMLWPQSSGLSGITCRNDRVLPGSACIRSAGSSQTNKIAPASFGARPACAQSPVRRKTILMVSSAGKPFHRPVDVGIELFHALAKRGTVERQMQVVEPGGGNGTRRLSSCGSGELRTRPTRLSRSDFTSNVEATNYLAHITAVSRALYRWRAFLMTSLVDAHAAAGSCAGCDEFLHQPARQLNRPPSQSW